MRNARYKFAIVFALALLATLWVAAPTSAQGVVGIVYDAESRRPIVGAEVFLFASEGEIIASGISNDVGRFFLIVGERGTYEVIATSLGYHTNSGSEVEFTDSGLSWVEVELAPDAIEIPGLVVTQEKYVRILDVRGYYGRKRRGLGRFVEPTESEKSFQVPFAQLLRRTPLLRSRTGTGSRCGTGYVVNGVPVSQTFTPGRELNTRYVRAIEVYSTLATAPAEFQAMLPTACSIVVIWTDYSGDG